MSKRKPKRIDGGENELHQFIAQKKHCQWNIRLQHTEVRIISTFSDRSHDHFLFVDLTRPREAFGYPLWCGVISLVRDRIPFFTKTVRGFLCWQATDL